MRSTEGTSRDVILSDRAVLIASFLTVLQVLQDLGNYENLLPQPWAAQYMVLTSRLRIAYLLFTSITQVILSQSLTHPGLIIKAGIDTHLPRN